MCWLLFFTAPALQAQQGTVTFALIGDVPYNALEVFALDAMIGELNREDLAFIIHVGDITSGIGPCTDAWFEARKRQLQKVKHPLVLIPGDNDWVDCHRSGMAPLERLEKFRQLFEAGDESLGRRPLRLERQSGVEFGEYREHMRWIAGNVIFIGLNVQGSNNNLGRTAAMDAEHAKRMRAVFAWLDEGMALAEKQQLAGVVIFAQANPDFEGRLRRSGVADGFVEFRNALRNHALQTQKPMLFVHGDTHIYRQDRPLRDPATGKQIEHFVRVEVFGSPQVRWIRARIDPASAQVFRVEPVRSAMQPE